MVAVPTAAPSTCEEFQTIADECICTITPEPFRAVGLWYQNFEQTSDEEVIDLLARSAADSRSRGRKPRGRAAPDRDPGSVPCPFPMRRFPGDRNMNANPRDQVTEREAEIPAGRRKVRGILSLPRGTSAVVVFAHGSGSGRFSPRNQFVARALQQSQLGTLLIDLLEEDEANDRSLVFDIGLLADRLQCAADWIGQQRETRGMRLGYFGASTGAGAALVAAARSGEAVGAVVSRGGRPDLAGDSLPRVTAPTLLIVGGDDEAVLPLNREAYEQLRCPRKLEIVPGATHLFAEPGALEEVARLAEEWFLRHLVHAPA